MKTPTDNAKKLYRTLWRWHFYAGLFCIPLVIALALTGAIYLFKPYYEHWQEAEYRGLEKHATLLAPNQQITAAISAVPGAKLLSYRLPQAPNDAVLINLQADDTWRVFVNPYSGEVLARERSDDMLMNIVKTLHGELLMGTFGSLLVELAACWAIVLIITGLYLWWPRNAMGMAGILYPRLRAGSRTFWRDIHAVTGLWISTLALFLLISGLPWALVWGGALKEVRSFELSSLTSNTPPDWTQSRAQEHQHWGAQASDVYDLTPAVVARAQTLGLAAPVELSIANAHNQSWKAASQTQNRPQRVDAWISRDGSLEKQSDFSQKNLIDRVIGVGIAAHEGALFGWLNLLLGLLCCVGLILISLSGFILWRKRKPSANLGAPSAMPARLGAVVVAITFGLALLLPLLAVSLVTILLLEFLLLRRIARVRDWLGLV